MKQPWEWDESDLQILIDTGVKESIELDYKRCDSLGKSDGKKTEISKDISALANSAGGTIIYGMVEDGHVPTKIDEGYDRSVISKEWLEQIINSNIHRRIDGIRINQIELATGKVVYVVYVPQSSHAPHQAADKRFYKRFNFESKPMEEYEIRDVSRRSEAPDLELSFEITIKNSLFYITPIIRNESATPAEYVVVDIFVHPKLCLCPLPPEVIQMDECGRGIFTNGEMLSMTRLHMIHAIPARIPIFQGGSFQLLSKPINTEIPDKGNYLISWSLKSPKMLPKGGSVFLKWDKVNAKIDKINDIPDIFK